MNAADAERLVRAALYSVAPDIEGQPLARETRYRDQFDFDSMDFMHYAMALHRGTGVEIPERDYPRLETLAGATEYLCAKTNPDAAA